MILGRIGACAAATCAIAACTTAAEAPSSPVPWAAGEPTRVIVSDTLALWFYAPTGIRVGQPVPMRLELESRRERGRTYPNFALPTYASFTVTTPDGREVWSHVAEAEARLGGNERIIGPDERIAIHHEWDQRRRAAGRDASGVPAPPGRYLLRASLRFADGVRVELERPLTIVP